MKITGKITGLRQADDALRQMPVRVARRAVQSALGAGGAVIRDEARRRAPIGKGRPHPKYGRLRRQIRVTVLRRAKGWRAVVHIGRAFWGVWLERGRSAFTIKRKRVLSDGQRFFGTKVRATPARPFFRPAFDTKKLAALRRIAERLGENIAKEAARLGGRR